MKIAIVVDSSTGLTPKQVEGKGWFFLPLSIDLNGTQRLDGTDITPFELKTALEDPNNNLKTGTTPYGLMQEQLQNLSEKYDKVVVFPISSGLSSQANYLKELKIDNLYVVDSTKITWLIIMDLLRFERNLKDGMDFEQSFAQMSFEYEGRILVVPYSTESIVKSGRLSPAAAAVARLFKIYPVIKLEKGKLEKEGIGRNFEKTLVKHFSELAESFKDDEYLPVVLHSYNSNIDSIVSELQKHTNKKIFVDILPNVVNIHLGLQGVAIGFVKCDKQVEAELLKIYENK